MAINENEKYIRNLELSFIVALLLLILVFYLFPIFNNFSTQSVNYIAPAIEVINIPKTNSQINQRPIPKKPFIPLVSDEIEILDYIEIEKIVEGDSFKIEKSSGSVEYTDLPYTPRQLYDVLPYKYEDPVSGLIVISLLIGIDGRVKDIKVIEDSINDELVLENVIYVAKKSRWESAVLNNEKVEYWIDKVYRFY